MTNIHKAWWCASRLASATAGSLGPSMSRAAKIERIVAALPRNLEHAAGRQMPHDTAIANDLFRFPVMPDDGPLGH